MRHLIPSGFSRGLLGRLLLAAFHKLTEGSGIEPLPLGHARFLDPERFSLATTYSIKSTRLFA